MHWINFDTFLRSFYIAVALVTNILFLSSFLCNYKYKLSAAKHNAYLESIKMNIIGWKLGKCQKHNEQILEHNRLKLNANLLMIKLHDLFKIAVWLVSCMCNCIWSRILYNRLYYQRVPCLQGCLVKLHWSS